MLRTSNLCQSVQVNDGTLHILKNINLDIQKGESVAIIGESGSGKTTLLGLLAGLDVPSEGNIFIDDVNITQMDEESRGKFRQDYVGFIFQNFQLLDSLTTIENIILPLEVRGGANAEATGLCYLDRVGLANRAHHYPKQLSGGEQQRVAIARAFACEAPIIFADEPTGNLDAKNGDKIAELLFQLNREKQTTLILVTHSMALAKRCTRQIKIQAGELVALNKLKAS